MGKFDVGIEALRQDARIWDDQSNQLKQVVQLVDRLAMDRLQAGIFQVFVSAYQDAVHEVSARATEGSAATAAIASTLASVADQYQQQESANTDRFTNLH
jgi:uncharacterized protein YukE